MTRKIITILLLLTFIFHGLGYGELCHDKLAVQTARNRERIRLELRRDELAREVRRLYSLRDPNATDIIESQSHEFYDIAIQLLVENAHYSSSFRPEPIEDIIEYVIKIRPISCSGREYQQYVETLRDVLEFCEQWNSDDDARILTEHIATIAAIENYLWHTDPSVPSYVLISIPENPPGLEDEIYIDLASGVNFGRAMNSLNPRTQYIAVDTGYFTCMYLRKLAELHGATNVTVLQEDVLKLRKPEGVIGTIRAKNITAYVDPRNFLPKLRKMLGWLYADDSTSGQLALESDPYYDHRTSLIRRYDELAKKLFKQGWRLECTMGTPCPNCQNCENSTTDKLIFTKALQNTTRTERAVARQESNEAWSQYTVTCNRNGLFSIIPEPVLSQLREGRLAEGEVFVYMISIDPNGRATLTSP